MKLTLLDMLDSGQNVIFTDLKHLPPEIVARLLIVRRDTVWDVLKAIVDGGAVLHDPTGLLDPAFVDKCVVLGSDLFKTG
jgi:hypothetical protein